MPGDKVPQVRQSRFVPLNPMWVMARGDQIVPLGPRDWEKQMKIEARLRKRERKGDRDK